MCIRDRHIKGASALFCGRTNVCIVANNASFNLSGNYVQDQDESATNIAAYFAGILVSDYLRHPSRAETGFYKCSEPPFKYRLYTVTTSEGVTLEDDDYGVSVHVTGGTADDSSFTMDNIYTGYVKLRRTLNGPYAEVANPDEVKIAYFKQTKNIGIIATNYVTLY